MCLIYVYSHLRALGCNASFLVILLSLLLILFSVDTHSNSFSNFKIKCIVLEKGDPWCFLFLECSVEKMCSLEMFRISGSDSQASAFVTIKGVFWVICGRVFPEIHPTLSLFSFSNTPPSWKYASGLTPPPRNGLHQAVSQSPMTSYLPCPLLC